MTSDHRSNSHRWENELLQELDLTRTGPNFARIRPNLRLEDVVLEGSYPDTSVVFMFYDARKPGCLFAFRWETFWEWVEGVDYVSKHGPETPASLATVMWANFDEARDLHLPEVCDPDKVNWIN